MSETILSSKKNTISKFFLAICALGMLGASAGAAQKIWRITGDLVFNNITWMDTLLAPMSLGEPYVHTFVVDDSVAATFASGDVAHYPAVIQSFMYFPLHDIGGAR